jgi:hypothetical protein
MAVGRTPGASELQASEVAVIHAASRIFAALIAGGRLTNGNQAGLVRSAVQMALEIAREAESRIHGGGELETGPAAGEGDILDLLDEGPRQP